MIMKNVDTHSPKDDEQILVNQVTFNPTNKLSAAILASALMGVVGVIIRVNFPAYYDPSTLALLTPVVVGVLGWWIKDSAVVST